MRARTGSVCDRWSLGKGGEALVLPHSERTYIHTFRVIYIHTCEKPPPAAVYEQLKLVIEPSAAVGVAALLSAEVKSLAGISRVGVVLCGGNADLDALPWAVKHAETTVPL